MVGETRGETLDETAGEGPGETLPTLPDATAGLAGHAASRRASTLAAASVPLSTTSPARTES